MRLLNRPSRMAMLAASVLAAAVVLMTGIGRLVIDNDVRHMMPPDHPQMEFCDEMDRLFGSSDAIVAAVDSPSGLTPDLVTRLREADSLMTGAFEKVMSLASGDTIIARGKTLTPERLLDDGPVTAETLTRLRERLTDWPIFANMLVSGDLQAPALLITMPPEWTVERRQQAVREIREQLAGFWPAGGPEEVKLAGEPVISLEIGERVNRDLTWLSPLALLMVLVVLGLSFRSLPGMAGPVLTVGLAIGATFGLMGYLGRPVMIISSAIPVFLVAVGSAYGIHVVAHFLRHLQEGASHREAAVRTVKGIGPAVVGAAVTTIVGFLSLAATDIIPVRDFGIFLAFGIVVALVASLGVVPLLMLLARGGRSSAGEGDPSRDRLARGLERLALGASRHPFLVLATASVLVVGLGSAALAWLRVDQDAVAMFPEESELRRADGFFSERFGGTHTLQIVISGEQERSLLEPSILRFMADLQRELEADPLVGKSISLADFVRRMNLVMHEGRTEHDTIPDSREEVAQYIQLYELSGDPDDFSNVADFEYRKGQILLQLRSGAASVARTVRELVAGHAANRLPPGYRLDYAGTVLRYEIVNSFIVSSQLWSLFLSLILVFVVVAILFRFNRTTGGATGGIRPTWRHAISSGSLTLLPIVLAVVGNFGAMALLDIPLEVGTTIIAACAVGIGIDYSVHFLHRYEVGLEAGLAAAEAVARAARESGKPIVFNAAAVAAGFLTLLLSGFLPVRFLGGLTALTMVVTSLAALTLLPALVTLRDRK